MVNLNGEFKVINKNGKYRIYYLEKTNMILCSKKTFDDEIDAVSYIGNHRTQLEEYVSGIIMVQQSKEDAKLEKETAKTVRKVQKEEDKANKKREKEEKKALKKAEKQKKKQEKKEAREKNKAERKKTRNTVIASVLATAMVLTGSHFLGVGISNLIEKNKKPSTSQDGSIESTSTQPVKDEPNTEISNGIDSIVTKDEGLNQENFEELSANFAKIYSDKNLNVTTEDIIKFVSIVNIDSLVEENPELAQELFGTQTKEEYLQDAAKIIGMTYSYNYQIFEVEESTENFIRISDSVYGPQKEVLKTIESYVDQIALVRNDSEKTNELIAELIVRLGDPQSDLSYLDNGVGFGMQVNIELIRSYLAKDVISKENFDMLSTMTSSEEYVSNIFTIYDSCMNSYTKTR